MKLVKPEVNLIPTDYDYSRNTMYRNIEYCAKICYGSQETRCRTFYDVKKWIDDKIKNLHHVSIGRHGSVYLQISSQLIDNYYYLIEVCSNSEYCCCDELGGNIYISTNYNFILDNEFVDEMKDLWCDNPIDSVLRYTVLVTCSIGVSRELNRVSPNNIMERSTRYCNFSKDKFDNNVEFVEPHYLENSSVEVKRSFSNACVTSEEEYFRRLELGLPPQDARGALNLDTKTICAYTYSVKDWVRILNARFYGITGTPHPDAKIIASMIFDKINILKNKSVKFEKDRLEYISYI